jgi:hypothetical protein
VCVCVCMDAFDCRFVDLTVKWSVRIASVISTPYKVLPNYSPFNPITSKIGAFFKAISSGETRSDGLSLNY